MFRVESRDLVSASSSSRLRSNLSSEEVCQVVGDFDSHDDADLLFTLDDINNFTKSDNDHLENDHREVGDLSHLLDTTETALSGRSSASNLVRKASSGSLGRSAAGVSTLRSNRSFPSLTSSATSATSSHALGALFFIGERLECHSQGHSCHTCGVAWDEQQFSFDCDECDGFALTKPCDQCDGHCGSTLTRNESASNALGKAVWSGTCGLTNEHTESIRNHP